MCRIVNKFLGLLHGRGKRLHLITTLYVFSGLPPKNVNVVQLIVGAILVVI